MCSVLGSVHGLKKEVYSCVAQRLRDCGSSIKEHDSRDCGSSFSGKILGGPGILQSSPKGSRTFDHIS